MPTFLITACIALLILIAALFAVLELAAPPAPHTHTARPPTAPRAALPSIRDHGPAVHRRSTCRLVRRTLAKATAGVVATCLATGVVL